MMTLIFLLIDNSIYFKYYFKNTNNIDNLYIISLFFMLKIMM